MADLSPARADDAAPSTLILGVLLALLLALGTAALAISYRVAADGYMTDDAFISFRYSKNLADGLGPVWQEDSRVEGYTNFGWVLLIAVTMKLGADPVDASRAIGLLASLGTLTLVPLATAQLRPVRSPGWWALTVGTCIALMVNTAFGLWTFAGLETPLFTCLILGALTAHWYEERTEQKRPWMSAIVLLFAALTRPDTVVVWGVIVAWKIIALLRRQLSPGALAGWAACFIVPFAIYWCWRWSYYGDFFPNTFYLKSGSGMEFYERGARYLWDFVVVYWLWILALALVSVFQEFRARAMPATCGVSLVLVWCAYIVGGGGDWMPYFRFFLPILPIAYLLTLHGAVSLGEAVGDRLPASGAVGLALAMAAVLVLSSLLAIDNARAEDPSRFKTSTGPVPLPGAVDLENHREVGLWMKANIPREYTIAQIATGVVPYYSELPTLDMHGVNDRHIARLEASTPLGRAGHDKQDGAYVLLSKPEVIWLSIGLEVPRRATSDDYKPPIDGRIAPVVVDITRNLYLWVYYRPVAIRFEGGWLNLIVRNDVTAPALQESSPP